MSDHQDILATQEKENKNGDTESTTTDTELSSCQEELFAWKDKLMRVSADFENFRRRIEKEKIQWVSLGQAEFIGDLLAVVDDFDRALQYTAKAEKVESEEISKQEDTKIAHEFKSMCDGFFMIKKSLYKLLEKYGVTEITNIKIFDPAFHEAISQIDSPSHKSGEIVQVLQKGFMFKEKVLRPAKVTVAQ